MWSAIAAMQDAGGARDASFNPSRAPDVLEDVWEDGVRFYNHHGFLQRRRDVNGSGRVGQWCATHSFQVTHNALQRRTPPPPSRLLDAHQLAKQKFAHGRVERPLLVQRALHGGRGLLQLRAGERS